MTELLEKVWLKLPPHDSDRCPFCPVKEDYQSPDSKVSDAGSAKTLGSNLNATGSQDDSEIWHFLDIKEKTQGLHGAYTLQAHHLICSNEMLGNQKEIQSYLCKQGRHDGKLQPCETGYDINAAVNGIWLPSTPSMYKTSISLQTAIARGSPGQSFTRTQLDEMAAYAKFHGYTKTYATELRALGVNTEKLWSEMNDTEQDAIAQVVMMRKQRQFHLGEHEGAAPPQRSYVQRGIKHLDTLTVFVEHYAKGCPMDDASKPRTQPPYVPPFRLNRHLNVLSKQMRSYIVGDPRRWKYFISKWALNLTDKLLQAP
jgi:hypothetical protein